MKAIIVGNGKSGKAAFELLKSENVEVSFLKQEDIDAKFFEKEYLDRLLKGLSFIVKSPGVPYDVEILKEVKNRKIKIVGEFELGAKRLQGDVIAVTGTNGKTTTVSLINFLLNGGNQKIFKGGNIGIPVSSFCKETKKEDISVLECSSFQLENISKFRPKISAILNLSPDHLNRHKTFKNYIDCKKNIAKNQTENDYLLINADEEILMKNLPKTKAKIFYFSTKKIVKGCYLKRGNIYFNDNLISKKIASVKDIKIVGEHNLSNALCATLAVWLETHDEEILKRLKDFSAVEHRIEFVSKINQISFYNDSKATNILSTLSAIKSFKCGINLILGGSDKGCDFDEFFAKTPKNIENIAIFGETRQKIAFSAQKYGFKNFYICDTLKASTLLLYQLAKEGEIVLLSPACASFDCFENYEERGNCFKKIVKEIENESVLFDSSKKINV